jgi:predicted RNA-binding Zn-ribbon protein involved in translation (DUF1610 family)
MWCTCIDEIYWWCYSSSLSLSCICECTLLYLFVLQVPFRTIMEDKPDPIGHVVYSTKPEDVESEPNLTLDNQASVVVKLELPDDLEISTEQFPYNAIHFQESKIKTESIIYDHKACDDYSTDDYGQQTIEINRICVKHEYKSEEDSTHVMSHTEEAGISVFVKSEMSDDSEVSTSRTPHNVPDGQDSTVKTEVIVNRHTDCEDDITHDGVQHSVECNTKCLKHEYSSPVMTPNVSGTVCTADIDIQHTCDTCTKAFPSKSKLMNHVRVHTGDKPYTCGTCRKSFADKSNLMKHMKFHADDKPFLCDTCGKSFIQKSDLTKHVRVHTGDTPFPCDTCGKTFSQRGSLVRHMKVHTDDKPFSCDTCGKTFIQKSHLIYHVRVHTGAKPFPCDTCGKTFSQRGSLVRHMKIHTDDKPFSCDTCGKTFIQKSDLIKHGIMHTGEKL